MGGYDKRGNMVLPVTNENGMNNVTLPEVTVTPRNINLAGAVEDKLNELTGKNIDYGKGGYCPHYQTIVSLWGSVVASSNYQPNQLVKEEDIVVNKDLFLINAETGSLYFAGGGTYAQIPAIDGHEDCM